MVNATVLNEKGYRGRVILAAHEAGIVVRDGEVSVPRFQEHDDLLPDIVRSPTLALLVLEHEYGTPENAIRRPLQGMEHGGSVLVIP